MGALHRDVDEVRATFDGGDAFTVETFDHEGESYYVLEVPAGTRRFAVDYYVDGEPVAPGAGEDREHVVP
jgi:hypothetical protein